MSTTNRTSATSEPSVRLTVLVPSSSNAYVALLSEALKKHGAATRKMTLSRLLFAHYDVLHLHWPEKLIRGRGLLGVLRLVAYPAIARIRRKQVIWTCHNLTPHEGLTSSWQRVAWDLFRRLVSGTVHLSFATREIAFECMPELAKLPSVVAPHGDYRWYYGTLADPAAFQGLASADLRSSSPSLSLLRCSFSRPHRRHKYTAAQPYIPPIRRCGLGIPMVS